MNKEQKKMELQNAWANLSVFQSGVLQLDKKEITLKEMEADIYPCKFCTNSKQWEYLMLMMTGWPDSSH